MLGKSGDCKKKKKKFKQRQAAPKFFNTKKDVFLKSLQTKMLFFFNLLKKFKKFRKRNEKKKKTKKEVKPDFRNKRSCSKLQTTFKYLIIIYYYRYC